MLAGAGLCTCDFMPGYACSFFNPSILLFLLFILLFLTYSFGHGGEGGKEMQVRDFDSQHCLLCVFFLWFFFSLLCVFPTPSSAFALLSSHSRCIALDLFTLPPLYLPFSFCHESKVWICFGILSVCFHRRHALESRLMVFYVCIRFQLVLSVWLFSLHNGVLMLIVCQGRSGA